MERIKVDKIGQCREKEYYWFLINQLMKLSRFLLKNIDKSFIN